MKKFNPDDPLRCSFCHKTQEQVEKLISSPRGYGRVYICNDCVDVCHTILQDENRKTGKRSGDAKPAGVRPEKFLDWVADRVFGKHRFEGSSIYMGRPSHQ